MKYKTLAFIVSLMLLSCNENNCTMENSVLCRYAFIDSETQKETALNDTLSIFTKAGKRILNRATGINGMQLPMSYSLPTDTLLLRFTSTSGSATDTLCISHTNLPHFESLECGTSFFHKITNTYINRRKPTPECPTAIDSILLVNPNVNYDQTINLHLYLSVLH